MFRKAVRLLKKPATAEGAALFPQGHSEVIALYANFFDKLKQESIGDIPAGL